MSFTIKRLRIKNFVTFREEDLKLSGQGLVLVKGRNMDEPWKGENACGKTLLGDSVSWLLSGTTSRDIYADGVIGPAAKSCCVSADVESNGVEYRVSRYRKDSKHGNSLMIEGANDASHRTLATTQERLEQIIGCSFGLFRLSCFQYGDPNKHFSRLKATERARILDEIVGASEADVPKRYATINKMMRDAEADLLELRHENDGLRMNMKSIRSMMEAQQENTGLEKGAIQAEIDRVNKQADELQSDDITEYQQQLAELEKRFEKEGLIGNTLNEIRATVFEKEAAFNQLQGEITVRKRELSEFERHMNIVPEEDICDKCGNPITKEGITSLLAERKKRQLEMSSSLIRKQKDQKRVADAVAGLNEKRNDLMKSIADDTHFKISKVRGVIDEKKRNNVRSHELRQTIPAIEKRMSEAAAKNKARIDSLKSNYARDAAKAQENIFKIHVVQRNIDVYETLSGFYSPGGFRPLVMEHYAPILSDCANFFYKSFTNGEGEVMIKTKTNLASGKVVDKIDIDVREHGKVKQFPGAWSNGEGGCIDLSLNAGIMRLASMKAAKEFNFLWLDEITNGLSNTWIGTLISILREKYLSAGATILLTSHHPIHQTKFDKVWTVVKKDGYSSVEQN